MHKTTATDRQVRSRRVDPLSWAWAIGFSPESSIFLDAT